MKTALCMCCLVGSALFASSPASAASPQFKVLYTGGYNAPVGALADQNGNVFTSTSGTGKEHGTVVRITHDLDAKVLYDFKGRTDPAFPIARLLRSPAGDLYGVANRMGKDNFGTAVFRISHGRETTLAFFSGGSNCSFVGPRAGLTMDAAGNLYGANCTGGASNMGSVFKIAPDGTTTVLHEFSGLDGNGPQGDLMIDANGNVVGTTYFGGAENAGTIFRIAPDGSAFTQLHSFDVETEGKFIWAGLVEDEQGNLYGTTNYAGPNTGGVAFKLSAKGKLSVLHAFGRSETDGNRPQGTLVRDSKGNLYGTTQYGGAYDRDGYEGGTVFKIAANGKTTILYSFQGLSDGAEPWGGLSTDAAGNLYGATSRNGNVFEIRR